MSQIHLLLFQKMGENLKYLVLFPDFNVLALLLHSIIFYVTGAGALSAWGDGPPQHPAEQGGRGLVSSLQVIISSRISLVLKRVFMFRFRFSPEGRELAEFQTRCNEYETDPEVSKHMGLSRITFL